MLHQTYAAQGDVQALRAVASRAVPIIQAHLSQLQALQISSAGPPADSGGSDTAARRAGERG
jgi:putative membrane protein